MRNVTPFHGCDGGYPALAPVYSAQGPPTLLPRVIKETGARLLFDWAGGLVWVALASGDDAGAAIVARAVGATGGHALLVRATPSMRASHRRFFSAGANARRFDQASEAELRSERRAQSRTDVGRGMNASMSPLHDHRDT